MAQGCRSNGVGQSLMTVGDKKSRLQMACGICKRDDNRICGGLGYARASIGEAQDGGERSGRGLSPDDAAIDIEHLGAHVVALKPGYIFHAAGYALVAPWSSHEHLADGMGHGSVVVGVYVEAVGASRLFQTTARAAHYRQPALDGFDDGHAETLVARGVDTRLCHLVERGQVGIGHAAEPAHPVAQSVGGDVVLDLLRIVGLPAHDDQRHIVYVLQRLHRQQYVLASLHGAHVDDVTAGQHVAGVHILELGIALAQLEVGAAALVDNLDAVGVYVAVVHDVALGALADGYDAVCLGYGAVEFPCVYLHIGPVVVLGMSHEDEVVDGDHRADAAAMDAQRQLARESVVEVYGVAAQVAHDAPRAPEPLGHVAAGVDKVHIGGGAYLGAQVVASGVGGVEQQTGVGIDDAREVVGQIASVAAQPRAVANDAFGVKSYFHVVGVKAVEATRRDVCRCCP